MMKVAPLKGSLMMAAIIGLFLSWFLMQNTTLPTFKDLMIATMLLCFILIVASFISMTYGPVVDYDTKREKHILTNHKPAVRKKLVKKNTAVKAKTIVKKKATKKTKKSSKKKSVKKKAVKKRSKKKVKK